MSEVEFVSFEGIDKTGKTVLCEMLKTEVPEYTFISDPPKIDPWGDMFTDGWEIKGQEIGPDINQSLFFLAGRFHVYQEEISQSLDEGPPVVADRYADSWMAYQPIVRKDCFDSVEDGFEFFKKAHEEFVSRGWLTNPDLTILITIDRELLESRLERIPDEEISRIEEDPDKLMEIQRIYRKLSREFSDRYLSIEDEGQGVERIYRTVSDLLDDKGFFRRV